MQFLIHGTVTPEGQSALTAHGHVLHNPQELSEDTDAPIALENTPGELLALLAKRQWNLFTTDADFVRRLYEEKILFPGVVVLMLDDPAVLNDQAPAVERLFERYKRLTPRRLYTITASRVKIRQLPGGHAA